MNSDQEKIPFYQTVQIGEKVAAGILSYGDTTLKIYKILTIKNITAKGTIIAIDESKKYIDSYQYNEKGYGKGRAYGQLVKVSQETIRLFYADQQQEALELTRQIQENKERNEKELEIYYQWIRTNCKISTVHTKSADIYIVEFPISNRPSTISMIFEERTGGKDYAVYIWMLIGKVGKKSEDDWLDIGTATYTHNKIEPLRVAAEWLKSNFQLSVLTKKEEVENVSSE